MLDPTLPTANATTARWLGLRVTSLACAVLGAFSLFMLLVCSEQFRQSPPLQHRNGESLIPLFGLLFFADLAATLIVLAIGLWKHQRWAWRAALLKLTLLMAAQIPIVAVSCYLLITQDLHFLLVFFVCLLAIELGVLVVCGGAVAYLLRSKHRAVLVPDDDLGRWNALSLAQAMLLIAAVPCLVTAVIQIASWGAVALLGVLAIQLLDSRGRVWIGMTLGLLLVSIAAATSFLPWNTFLLLSAGVVGGSMQGTITYRPIVAAQSLLLNAIGIAAVLLPWG